MSLIDSLISSGYLNTPRVTEAFQRIKRIDFLPEDLKYLAEADEALPIGEGQTISQPAVVAFMIELLEPRLGDKILDIGSGSGWTTALLAYIVSQKGNPKSEIRNSKLQNSNGKVIAIEVIPELKEFGEKNIGKYNFIKKGIVECVCSDGSKGCPNIASRPELVEGFDKILVSAAAHPVRNTISNGVSKVPEALKEQLKIEGRLVIPIQNSIWLFINKGGNRFEEHEYPGFVFVPLIEKH